MLVSPSVFIAVKIKKARLRLYPCNLLMFHRLYCPHTIIVHIQLGFTKIYLTFTCCVWNKHLFQARTYKYSSFFLHNPWVKGFIDKVEFSILKEWDVLTFCTTKIKIPFSLQSVIWRAYTYPVTLFRAHSWSSVHSHIYSHLHGFTHARSHWIRLCAWLITLNENHPLPLRLFYS